MEYMIAWYPALKLIIGLAFLGLAVYLGKKGKFGWALGVLSFVGFMYFMIPVGIDGTNSKAALEHESQYQDSKYKYQAEETVVQQKPVLTFDEQLAIIDAKSEEKNKKIEEDLK